MGFTVTDIDVAPKNVLHSKIADQCDRTPTLIKSFIIGACNFKIISIRVQEHTGYISLLTEYDVLTEVTMTRSVHWDIIPCSHVKVNRRFLETCYLHLHGRTVSTKSRLAFTISPKTKLFLYKVNKI
jgi:hypothetical protein